MGIPNTTLGELLDTLKLAQLDNNYLVHRAISQAQTSHGSQRRDDGSSYLEQHIYSVTKDLVQYRMGKGSLPSVDQVCASILHDSLEDDPALTEHMFLANFGDSIFRKVKSLTKGDYNNFPGKNKHEKKRALTIAYLGEIEKQPLDVQEVKIFDRRNNIQCLSICPDPQKVAGYVKETEELYIPFAQRVDPILATELRSILDQL